jgi:acyl carrier protein
MNKEALEHVLIEEWSANLDRTAIDSTTNFFVAGGSSVRAAEMMARLSQVLGVRLRMRLIAENPTPRLLAAAITAQLNSADLDQI